MHEFITQQHAPIWISNLSFIQKLPDKWTGSGEGSMS